LGEFQANEQRDHSSRGNCAPNFRFPQTKVMLDSDLPILYGVSTGHLNRAVKRNPDRFPPDFMFQLSLEEVHFLKCQFGISKPSRGDRPAEKGTPRDRFSCAREGASLSGA
jgi:hypothetical protein